MQRHRLEPHTQYPDSGRTLWGYLFPKKKKLDLAPWQKMAPFQFTRSRTGRSSRKRTYPRRSFRKKSFRRRSRRSSRGFKRRNAHAGSSRFTPNKVVHMMESKVLEQLFTNNVVVTNASEVGTVVAEFAICPTQNLLQQTNTAASLSGGTFTGTKIWLKGIRLQFYVTSNGLDAFDFKVFCFKTQTPVDYTGFNWGALTNTGTEVTSELDFFDRTYGAPVAHPVNFLAPVNVRGGGPTCIFQKSYHVQASASAQNSQVFKKVDIYLPLNKIEEFHHQLNSLGLQTAPNYMKNGDYLFIFKYLNSTDPSATVALTISGTQTRIYFKDP